MRREFCLSCCSRRASISLFFCAISSSCCRMFAVVLADLDCETPNQRLAFPGEGGKGEEGGQLALGAAQLAPGRGPGGALRADPGPEALRGADPSGAQRGAAPRGRGEPPGAARALPGASRGLSILELPAHHAPRPGAERRRRRQGCWEV